MNRHLNRGESLGHHVMKPLQSPDEPEMYM